MRSRRVAACVARQRGRSTSRKRSKGTRSRKKKVSFVVIASTTARASAGSGKGLNRATRSANVARPCFLAHRREAALDEVALLGRERETRAALEEAAQEVELGLRHRPAPSRCLIA